MKCLDALGRWEEAIQLCIENLEHLKAEGGPGPGVSATHTKAAVIGARAAWSLNGWNLMDNIVSQVGFGLSKPLSRPLSRPLSILI